MDEFIATFHIDWKLMLAQVINFGLVFLALYMLAAKPLKKLVDERSNEISKGLDDAKKSRELLLLATEEYKQNSIKLRKLSVDTQVELKKDLEKLRQENIEKMRLNTEEWKKNRIKQMEIDKRELIESAKKDVMSLATFVAEKIMNDKNK
ncbi:MAG: ATP synthase subunit b [Candidatus Nomurabacteria bacterium GW2011_GWA2_40_9]|uniref:ATP synthase subunit b n=1 Tax=Candidatus Nomurabacteria bacterium GW2011_GWA2_40_9 TaxID=1618734 RepID=A0A0G0TS82_9BACT|nr:MAG: ATP synthase subunit b [Candidatus Nomurabacteria bacterium GW2011_GWA2_40_9]